MPGSPDEPTTSGPSGSPPGGRRWVRPAATLLAIVALASAAFIGRRTLAGSVTSLGRLDFRWFLLGLLCEGISLSAFGISRRRLLRAGGQQARFGSVMAITYAGNALSMSVPVAGAQLAVVFSYRQFRRRGLDPAVTGWALAVSAIASSSSLAVVLLLGGAVGGAPLANAAGLAGALIFGVPAVMILLALRYQRARVIANRGLAYLVRVSRRLLGRPGADPGSLEDFLDRLSGIRLGWRGGTMVFCLSVVNWLADCACLACAIAATGARVPWQGLILAYGAGALAGSTGVTPGGFGLVEVALTAALVATGMNTGRALTSVLAYRLLNFWLILAGGGIAMLILTHGAGRRVRPYAPSGPRPDQPGRPRPDQPGRPRPDQPGRSDRER